MSKFFFRTVLAIICVLCFYTGYLGYRYGAVNWYYGLPDNPVFTPGLRMLDSNLRFFNGLWVAIGLILLWMIPNAAKQTHIMRNLAVMFFLGGIGRIVSIAACGVPPLMYLLFIPIELGFPLLALWQHRIALKG